MNLQKTNVFSFKVKNGGVHAYSYNERTRVSSFYMVVDEVVTYREDVFSTTEEGHLKRISQDFNENCIDAPKKRINYTKWIRKISSSSITILIVSILVHILIILITIVGKTLQAIDAVVTSVSRCFRV